MTSASRWPRRKALHARRRRELLSRDILRHRRGFLWLSQEGSMQRVARRCFASVLLLLATAVIARAQAGSTAQISGVIRDTSGAVLPGAEVTVTQTDTGLKRSTVSSPSGAYTLPNLPVGPYKLDVNLPGFKTYSQTGIVLQVDANPVINV